MGVVASSAQLETTLTAIAGVGLQVDRHIVVGGEWDEWAYEHARSTPYALRAARLRRDPDRYIAEFGRHAYDIMLGDCLWHIYALIGKLTGHVMHLTKTDRA